MTVLRLSRALEREKTSVPGASGRTAPLNAGISVYAMVACVPQVAEKFAAMSDAVVGSSTSRLEHCVRVVV